MVGNHLLQHADLSATAIGVAAYIQSLPDGAPVGIEALTDRFREGEVRIASALRELERHGYLEREPAPVRARALDALPVPRALHHGAADLLAGLRRHDPRLLLAERDVRRLVPGVSAWLERGADPEAVARVLSGGLPERMRDPASVLAYRLGALIPPHLPPAPVVRRPIRPDPLQNCDNCDRAFRVPAPGRCRGCPPAAA
ncbi:helix-turn-helix domain-containing protein [Streptomyces sp. NPDC048424]|uniref:helix-turn-helix domain-containing protein n=1 Tax=Streptomyces sp. NPDC048424 TaxID=3155265 RepID=UPI00341346D7